mgnify:CR=1 FL=1
MTMMTTPELTTAEEARLAVLVSQVQEGQREIDRGAVRIGQALIEIRQRKLYRQVGTIEEFAQQELGYSRQNLYRLINFAEVRQTLTEANFTQLPDCERQARPLVGLPAEKQAEAWGAAVQEGGRTTGAVVEVAVAQVKDSFAQGQKLKVIDARAPYADSQVTVKEDNGDVVVCETPDGGDFTYFRSELEGGRTPKPRTPVAQPVPQVQPHELLSMRLDLANERTAALETMLKRVMKWLPDSMQAEVSELLGMQQAA